MTFSDDYFEFRKFSLATLFCCALLPEQHREGLCFSLHEVQSVREAFLLRRAYEYARERIAVDRNENWFRIATKSMYQHELGASFFVERAAEIAHQKDETRTGFGNFISAAKNTRQFLDYPITLSQQSFEDF